MSAARALLMSQLLGSCVYEVRALDDGLEGDSGQTSGGGDVGAEVGVDLDPGGADLDARGDQAPPAGDSDLGPAGIFIDDRGHLLDFAEDSRVSIYLSLTRAPND